MSGQELTPDERRAVQALKRVAARWPRSLGLFANNGSLEVVRWDGGEGGVLVDWIDGIPCDGGDTSRMDRMDLSDVPANTPPAVAEAVARRAGERAK